MTEMINFGTLGVVATIVQLMLFVLTMLTASVPAVPLQPGARRLRQGRGRARRVRRTAQAAIEPRPVVPDAGRESRHPARRAAGTRRRLRRHPKVARLENHDQQQPKPIDVWIRRIERAIEFAVRIYLLWLRG